jgi:hypothetical protein
MAKQPDADDLTDIPSDIHGAVRAVAAYEGMTVTEVLARPYDWFEARAAYHDRHPNGAHRAGDEWDC